MKKLVWIVPTILVVALGVGGYFLISEEAKERKALEQQLADERDAREREEKRLEQEREDEEERIAAEEAEREFRAEMVRSSLRRIKRSIRDEYTENGAVPSSVGCTRVSPKSYECIVEYYDDYFQENMSDLVEAKVNPTDGSFVWSER